MKRRLLIFFFPIFLLNVSAQSLWDGVSVTEPKLSGNTYDIVSADELAWVSRESATRDFAGQQIKLHVDVNLDSHPWQPIGSAKLPFAGVFDGGSHTVFNLNIMGLSGRAVGFIAALSSEGRVFNLAIGQGTVFLKSVSEIGALVGRNMGTVDHCISMLQIVAHDGHVVGSMVGHNAPTGVLRQSYNTGIITDAIDSIGGLVGFNEGQISDCYNVGYCVDGGAACGFNNGTVENVYCDQKMCRKEAGYGNVKGIVLVMQTRDMYAIFEKDAEWITSEDRYPQLKAFAGTNVSLLSTAPVTILDRLTERAELLTLNFWVSLASGITWYSPLTNIVKIVYGQAIVNRPCQTQTVILEGRKAGLTKQVYISVKGFDVFSAGMMTPDIYTCRWHPEKITRGAGSVSGGKDDDKDNFPYTYKIERYNLVDGGGLVPDTVLVNSTVVVGDKDLGNYVCNADSFGTFIYKFYAHDALCHTDFLRSSGVMRYHVYNEFSAGSILSNVDTIYGSLPLDTTILEVAPPQGGNGRYHYRWFLTQQSVNYVTDERKTLINDKEVRVNAKAADTSQLVFHIDTIGEYLLTRWARDEYCQSSNEYVTSHGTKRFVVLDELRGGELDSAHLYWCEPRGTGILSPLTAPTGGNGRYSYRWLLDGKVIEGAVEEAFDLSLLRLDYNRTYVLRRQVKDDTGLMDWTYSDGADTLTVRPAMQTGRISSRELKYCLTDTTLSQTISVALQNEQLPSGEGPFSYKYRLRVVSSADTLTVASFPLSGSSETVSFVPSDYSKYPLPATFMFERLVCDTLCHTSGQPSGGRVAVRIATEQTLQQVVRLCPEQLPYKSVYTMHDGKKREFELRRDSDVVYIDDLTPDGCPKKVSIRCEGKYPPEVLVDTMSNLCQSVADFALDYQILSGTPTHCSVRFDESALRLGMKDTVVLLDGSGVLRLSNDSMATGDILMSLTFFDANDKEACEPREQKMKFTFALDGYVYRKWNDVLFVDNNPKNGYPDPLTDLRFVSYQWYKDGQPIQGATEQYYREDDGLNGIYFVVMVDDNGNEHRSCYVEARPLTAVGDVSADGLLTVSPVCLRPSEQLSITTFAQGELACYDMSGKRIFIRDLLETTTQVAAPSVKGMYLMVLNTKYGSAAQKIIVR